MTNSVKLRVTEYIFMNTSVIKFNPNRNKNVSNTGKGLFTPLNEVWPSLYTYLLSLYFLCAIRWASHVKTFIRSGERMWKMWVDILVHKNGTEPISKKHSSARQHL